MIVATGEVVYEATCRRCGRPDWTTATNAEAAEAELVAEGWRKVGDDHECSSCRGVAPSVRTMGDEAFGFFGRHR